MLSHCLFVCYLKYETIHLHFPRDRCLQTTIQNCTKCFKNVKIIECHFTNIWNHLMKCIQISTNVPIISSVILEIDIKVRQICFVPWLNQ